jgi:hypothetical protein
MASTPGSEHGHDDHACFEDDDENEFVAVSIVAKHLPSAAILDLATPGGGKGIPDIFVEHAAFDHSLPGVAAYPDTVRCPEAPDVGQRGPGVHGRENIYNLPKRHVASQAVTPTGLVSTETDQAHTEAELQAALERLKAENAALESRGSKGVSMKVSEKGGVSVYGLGRFPVTLYLEQWTKLLDLADDIRAFIEENEGNLKKKE